MITPTLLAHLDRSFTTAGVSRDVLHDILRQLCPAALKGYNADATKQMRAEWRAENPTRFCCYFVSEMVFWYCAPVGSVPMGVPVDGDASPHRYTRWPDGTLVDLTCDQFGDFDIERYRLGKPLQYLQTGGKGPSQRARDLASRLGKTEIIWKSMRPETVTAATLF